jgi:hypothetical protein
LYNEDLVANAASDLFGHFSRLHLDSASCCFVADRFERCWRAGAMGLGRSSIYGRDRDEEVLSDSVIVADEIAMAAAFVVVEFNGHGSDFAAQGASSGCSI